MSRCWSVLAIVVVASAAGCGEATTPPASPTGSAAVTPDKPAGKATLSAEDQVLADKQKVCPVGGEPLGSMGTPVKMMVGDRAVFLCCEGCRGAVESDPAKYLAKLDAPAAAPAEAAPEDTAPTAPTAP